MYTLINPCTLVSSLPSSGSVGGSASATVCTMSIIDRASPNGYLPVASSINTMPILQMSPGYEYLGEDEKDEKDEKEQTRGKIQDYSQQNEHIKAFWTFLLLLLVSL